MAILGDKIWDILKASIKKEAQKNNEVHIFFLFNNSIEQNFIYDWFIE